MSFNDNRSDSEYDQAELDRALDLMKKGSRMGEKSNFKGATHLYLQALEILLNIGAYRRIPEVFFQLSAYVKTGSDILFLMEKVRNTIEEMEYLDIPEEMAKLKLGLANLAYKDNDFLLAGNLYAEVAELFMAVDPEEFRQASGTFYLRASECLEKIGRTERAEKLALQAIRIFDTSNFNYETQLSLLQKTISDRKFAQAVEILREIAGFYRTLEEELEKSPEYSPTFRNIKNNITARLFHMVSEFNLLKMICYQHLEERDKVKEQAEKSIEDLTRAINFIKKEVQAGNYSSGDLHRLTFDIFLLQVFQEYADYQVENPIDLAMFELPNEVKTIVQKMKFYEYTSRILELDLKECGDMFGEIALSQILDPYRDFIIKGIELIKEC